MKKVKSNYKVGDIIIHKPSKTVYCIHEIATWTKRGDAMCNTLCTTLGAGMTGGQFYADDTNLCLVDEFFSQNLCIPKADILHEWIEGSILQYKAQSMWVDYAPYNLPHRIKPSEPVMEWQWMLFGKGDDTYNHCYGIGIGYSTDEEIDEEVYRWVKIEETKRVRQ